VEVAAGGGDEGVGLDAGDLGEVGAAGVEAGAVAGLGAEVDVALGGEFCIQRSPTVTFLLGTRIGVGITFFLHAAGKLFGLSARCSKVICLSR
jgi:hypothetical protein